MTFLFRPNLFGPQYMLPVSARLLGYRFGDEGEDFLISEDSFFRGVLPLKPKVSNSLGWRISFEIGIPFKVKVIVALIAPCS